MVTSAFAAGPEVSREQIDFFEAKIRPVLIENCYQCHSQDADELRGSLLLDSRQGLRHGGDSGAVIVPGDPDASLLIKAIRYTDDDLRMPPAKNNRDRRLPDEVVHDFENWIRMGAPDPRTRATVAPAHDMSARDRHWAFRTLEKPELPEVDDKDRSWVATPIDAFVLAKLREQDLEPNAPADRRTLLRRITYDLTGLPPTPEEVDAFLADDSPDAYERVVDRLLASPAYGERWGRFWLDVARYADTKGRQGRYPFAHTYRDYVINAFNEDKPFDRFILEQLAADQLDLEERKDLAAMGYLTLGRTFLGRKEFIIDDQIDVVTRGLQGLTVSCARCHNHKFDPIPTADFYGLHGVFASSDPPDDLPIIDMPGDEQAFLNYLDEVDRLEVAIAKEEKKTIDKWIKEERAKSGSYLLAAREGMDVEDGDDFITFAGSRKLNPDLLRQWMDHVAVEENRQQPVLAPWFARDDPEDLSTELTGPMADAASSPSAEEAADLYDDRFAAALKDPEAHPELWRFITAEGSPANPARSDVRDWIARKVRGAGGKLRFQLASLDWTHPGAPTRAQTLVDVDDPEDSPIYKRGNPQTKGPVVPRQFLEIIAGPNRTPFPTDRSGRLELARAIAAPDNPLTARVFVNRVWGWRFGQNIVDTPSDFGVRTEEPLHIELLDWLAASFIESGWSVKVLHRWMALSNTYRQASTERDYAVLADPENKRLHHFPRQRLDFEAMRDTLLAVAGNLDRTMGGLPFNVDAATTNRRTVYSYIDRHHPPGILRTFDMPAPEATSPGRFETVVPQQALYLMNNPFTIRQAKFLAERILAETAPDEEARIRALYRHVYQRPPSDEEIQDAKLFLNAVDQLSAEGDPGVHWPGDRESKEVADTENDNGPIFPKPPPAPPLETPTPLQSWELYAQALLISNEFIFLD
ncbi:MAG: hypothetical protein SynsKO_26510 [Synoicihabitans sp.]